VTYLESVDGIQVSGYEIGAEMAWLGQRGDGSYPRTTLVNTLNLADGSKRFQCAIEEGCAFVGQTIQSITAGHGPKAHNSGNGGHQTRTKVLAAKGDIMDMSLRDFVDFVAKHGDLIGDAESWRDRALAAERRLAVIGRQFE
jgi:hypothetical protein